MMLDYVKRCGPVLKGKDYQTPIYSTDWLSHTGVYSWPDKCHSEVEGDAEEDSEEEEAVAGDSEGAAEVSHTCYILWRGRPR